MNAKSPAREGQGTVLFMPFLRALGHAGRTLLIARELRQNFAGTIACAGSGKYAQLFTEADFPCYEVEGGVRLTLAALLSNRRFADDILVPLRHVVESELQLYRALRPTLMVWDLKPTALLSAELYGMPVIPVMHSYMIPFTDSECCFTAGLPGPWPAALLGRLPEWVQRRCSRWLRGVGFGLLLKFYNKLRVAFDLAPLRDAVDFFGRFPAVLIAEPPPTRPAAGLPAYFHYVGPLIWQPAMEFPEALRQLDGVIYVSMGSSGDPKAFKPLIEALARLPEYPVVITTGDLIGEKALGAMPKHIHLYRYLPGHEITRRARLVICAGGATMEQALGAGVPVLAIPVTFDHAFQATRLQELGAGRHLDRRRLHPETIRATVRELIEQPAYRQAAQAAADGYSLDHGPQQAAAIILQELARIEGSQRVTA